MTEPITILGLKVGTAASMGAGSFVAALLMNGQPWYVRVVAGISGCAAAYILTPILTPLAMAAWVKIYTSLGISPDELSRDSVAGFVGFASALTGIDICRWIIDRTKYVLSKLKIPSFNWGKGSKGD